MNVIQYADISFAHRLLPSPLFLTWLSPNFSLTLLHLRSFGMSFLCSLTLPQHFFFFFKSLKFLGGKEIFYVRFVAMSFNLSFQFCHLAWVAVQYCAMHCLSFPKWTHILRVTSWVVKFVNFDAKTLAFLGHVLSENHPSFAQHSHFINFQIFWRSCKILKMSCLDLF